MRSTLISGVVLAGLVLLTGCSSSEESSPSASNAGACTQFAEAHDGLTTLAKDGPVSGDADKWTSDKNAEIAKFAPLASSADGSVKEALDALVTALPADSIELTEVDSESGTAFVTNSDAVASACGADGSTIELSEFPLQTFG